MLYIVFIVHGLFWLRLLPQSISSLFLFEMPAMFIISGYAYFQYEDSRARKLIPFGAREYFFFIVSRFTRILTPYLVYALACIALLYFWPGLGKFGEYNFWSLFIAWINPFNFGKGFTSNLLDLHLWFIPVFLFVSALLPFAAKLRPFKNPNFLLLLLGIAILAYASTKIQFTGSDFAKKILFYLLFALFGYYLARSADYFSRARFGLIALASLLLMVGLVALNDWNLKVMDMQVNKFPPNHIFFIFSCFWISLFLFLGYRSTGILKKMESCIDQFWLSPFVKAGYSIYLWQGIGYTLAVEAGKALDINKIVVWFAAVLLSVILGGLAAPMERIRLRV